MSGNRFGLIDVQGPSELMGLSNMSGGLWSNILIRAFSSANLNVFKMRFIVKQVRLLWVSKGKGKDGGLQSGIMPAAKKVAPMGNRYNEFESYCRYVHSYISLIPVLQYIE